MVGAFGVPDVGVRGARALGDAAHRGDARAQGHRRRQAELGAGRAVAERGEPVDADADADEVVAGLADRGSPARTRRGGASTDAARRRPRPRGRARRPSSCAASTARDVLAKWLNTPDHRDPAAALVLGRPRDHARPVLLGHAVAAEARVDLQVHAGGGRPPTRHAARSSCSRLETPTSTPALDGPREVGVGVVQPGEDRRVDPRGAELERLVEVGDAEPRRAAGERRARRLDGAVSVARWPSPRP